MSDEKSQDMRIFTSDVRQPSEKKAAQPLLGNLGKNTCLASDASFGTVRYTPSSLPLQHCHSKAYRTQEKHYT